MIFPRTCCGCGHLGQYLCPDCSRGLLRKGIGIPKDSRLEGQLSLFRYRGLIKTAISELKFNFVSDIVDELSGLIAYSLVNSYPHLLRYWQENKFVFVPIPLHQNRMLWRGYNQSALITQKTAFKLNMATDETILIRTRYNQPQSLIKDRRLRKKSLINSFSCVTQSPPQNVILFDDVFTSGATLTSAAATLPSSCHVWGLTLAG